MPAKKPKPANLDNMSNDTIVSGGALDDVIVISDMSTMATDNNVYIDSTSVLDIGNIDTITLDSSYITSSGTGLNWNTSYDYSFSNTITTNNVNIGSDGITMKSDCDLKIGDHSLKDFIERVEDRLAILHPNAELEDRWEQLKDLRRQYEALEKDILEKEKIMNILKK